MYGQYFQYVKDFLPKISPFLSNSNAWLFTILLRLTGNFEVCLAYGFRRNEQQEDLRRNKIML